MFTTGSIQLQVLACVHAAPSLRVVERSIERRVQRGSFIGVEVIIGMSRKQRRPTAGDATGAS